MSLFLAVSFLKKNATACVKPCSRTSRKARRFTGKVKNITDYGVFVDLGGLDGLLHITDMAWKRIRHPKEMVQIGDELELMVLNFDKEHQKVSLGLKQLVAGSVDQHCGQVSGGHPD
jgi:predicted RNA-binding protein with RPS1 domain